MPDDGSLKALARAIARIEAFVEKFPLDAAKDLRARIATIRTLLLEKRPPALALVGRRGAGKSSLVNALFGAKMAQLGHVTAQTGRGHWYDYEKDGGAMSILDTRGMQEGSAPSESDDAKTALESIGHELRAKAPDVIVFVVKASDVDSAIDADLDALEDVYDELRRAHRVEPPLVAVITHCDLLDPKSAHLPRDSRPGRASRSAAEEGDDEIRDVAEKMHHVVTAERTLASKIDGREKLRARHVSTMGVSAYMSWRDVKVRTPAEKPERSENAGAAVLRADERWRIDELAVTLFRHLPDAGRAELARATQARAVQEELAATLSKATAAIAAAIAATPVPFADVLPLTALQAGLVAAIAWIGGRSLDRRGASEFLASLGVNVGAAFALRQAFRGLLKLIAPGGGPVLSAAIAFSGTMAVGTAARAYFVRGVSTADAKKIFRRSPAEKDEEQSKP
jgi:uncharacterized protein (DUF697 family)/GTP-binding protein EngB required for normal cell division